MTELRPLSENLQERSINELNENPDSLLSDLKILREWVKQQSHIRARTSDQFLVAFLRGCKFNLEKAKKKLEKYYSLQVGIPEVFNNRLVDDEKLLEIIRMGVILKLPIPKDSEGPCINIIRATIYDTNVYKFADVLRLGVMLGEIMMLEDDNSVISGYIEIMDMQNVGASHLFQLHPNLLRKCSVYADEANPMRQKGTHFINVPPAFDFGFRGLKAIFPEKVTKRIFVHPDKSETLYSHVPKKYLPIEYGGENGTIAEIIASTEKKFLSYREYFKEGVNFGIKNKIKHNECNPANINSFFGLRNSFRRFRCDFTEVVKRRIMPNIRPLSDKLQLKAIDELHEVPGRLDEDIASLRSWIEKQSYLKARTDDQFLVTFLRGCKFSLEKAKDKIDKYYTLRTIYESSLTCRNVDDARVQEVFQLGITSVLPNPLGEDGPRILIIRVGAYAADKYTLTEIMRASTALQQLVMQEDDNVVVSGYVQILDFTDVTTAHFFQLNPSFMKRFSVFTEEALPLRMKSAHFINTPIGFETVFNSIKSLMPVKMQERLIVHGKNTEELYQTVPLKYLPKDYGGENGSFEEITNFWAKKVVAHLDFYKEDAQYKTDEKLRPGKPASFDNVFGTEGSFRKIDVD
ncbi:uncharacterized protein LOC129950080 [Eupeodes corollae]|uniref:uncharacterized protein LOC129950080 n=1 Tax=Eupeodes corollae TaxID=290404 RepID=UPI002492C808|nr:uncharacterized protein LOC129950080 [Eupeodes corollae]